MPIELFVLLNLVVVFLFSIMFAMILYKKRCSWQEDKIASLEQRNDALRHQTSTLSSILFQDNIARPCPDPHCDCRL